MTTIDINHKRIAMPEVAEPPTPDAGEGELFLGTDGLLKAKYDTGDVEQVSIGAGFQEDVFFYRNLESVSAWNLTGWSMDSTRYSELLIEMGIRNDGSGAGTLHMRPNGTLGAVTSLFDGLVSQSRSGVASSSYRLNAGEGIAPIPGWVSPANTVAYWTHYAMRFWRYNDTDAPMHWQTTIGVSFDGTPDTYTTALASGAWLSNSPMPYLYVAPSGGALVTNSWYRIQQQ